jgi:lysophospholipase L1-like esterase
VSWVYFARVTQSDFAKRICLACLTELAMLAILTTCGRSSRQPYVFKLLDSSQSGSPFSRVHFISNTAVQVTTDCSIFPFYPNYAEASLIVDGQYSQTLKCTSASPQTFTVEPGFGSIVDIVSGTRFRAMPESSVTGNTIQDVLGNAWATTEAAKQLVVIYGDSIACGFGSDVPSRDAWTVLLRKNFEVGVEAWGSRQLTTDYDAGLDELILNFVSYGTPRVFWVAIGVNDFFYSENLTNFNVEYALLLDAIHSRFPGARIFAQTPLSTVWEGPNVSGYTLGGFRNGISQACAERSFCHFVDGTSILSLSDLSPDGVHPTTAGNAKYESYVLTMLLRN